MNRRQEKREERKRRLIELSRNVAWVEMSRRNAGESVSSSVDDVRDQLISAIRAEFGSIGIIAWIQILYYAWKIWRLLDGSSDALESFASEPAPHIMQAIENPTYVTESRTTEDVAKHG